jgi:hypothetical protein
VWTLDTCFQQLRAGENLPEAPATVGPSREASDGPAPCQPSPLTESKCPAFVTVYDHVPGHGNADNDFTYDYGTDVTRAMAMAPAGDLVYVTGTSIPSPEASDTSDYDIATAAFDPSTGVQRWVARYDGPTNAYDDPSSMVVSPDGRTVYVSGVQGLYRPDPPQAVVLAYDASTGGLRWSSSYSIPGDDQGVYDAGLAISPGGERLVVAGMVARTDQTVDMLTFALDAATGARDWDALYDGPKSGWDIAVGAGVTSDGARAIVAGTSYDPDYINDNYTILAYDLEDGTSEWVSQFDGQWASEDVAVKMAINPAGHGIAVTGRSRNFEDFESGYVNLVQNYDWATVMIDEENGRELWVHRYTGIHRGDNRPFDVTFSPSGDRVYAVGAGTSDFSPHDLDFVTTAYMSADGQDAMGAFYAFRYTGPTQAGGIDVATSVSVGPDGKRLYVTGYSGPAPIGGSPVFVWSGPFILNNLPVDMATVAYNTQTMNRLWTARYMSGGVTADTDVPVDSVVSPNGSRLYVADWFEYRVDQGYADPATLERTNFFDYGLVAYDK